MQIYIYTYMQCMHKILEIHIIQSNLLSHQASFYLCACSIPPIPQFCSFGGRTSDFYYKFHYFVL